MLHIASESSNTICMTTFTIIVLVLLVVNTLFSLILDGLNRSNVIKHHDQVPAMLKGIMDMPTYQKSVQYTLAKNTFSMVSSVYGALILGIILFSGILPWLFNSFIGFYGTALWAQALTLWALTIIFSIPELPFEWWYQFRLEEKFGFNKSTLSLWVTDKLKSFILSMLIGVALIYVLLWLVQKFPHNWWILGFITLFGFQIIMMVLYPIVILPLFNKLSPLPEGELKERLMALSQKAGFYAKTIEVIDGSKRSGHSNAYFTGFGKFRRIVLFDTLIDQLTVDELEAVLAHEIGHYKCGHIIKMLTVGGLSTFAAFAIINYLSHSSFFFSSFGFNFFPAEATMAITFLLFSLLAPLFTFWLTPLAAFWSRKYEYEADSFAARVLGRAQDMITALRKLHEKNLGNLTPHPIYSAFHYSHPTLLEREKALQTLKLQ